jgi:hypothetical protein
MFPLFETPVGELDGSRYAPPRGVTVGVDEPYQVSAQVLPRAQVKMRIVKLMKAPLTEKLAPGWETGERVIPFRMTVGDVLTFQQSHPCD